jgi:hypothetical protein
MSLLTELIMCVGVILQIFRACGAACGFTIII